MDPATLMLAETLLTQGLQYWMTFQQKKAAGVLTLDDVKQAAALVTSHLSQLEADIAALDHA